MVRAIIVPGNGADGDIRRCNFYGWLADALHKSGRFTEVLLRNMPDPEGARRSIWVPFMLHELGADATTVVIGHSSGAVAALRLLEEHRLHGAVIVSPCHTHLGDMNELMSGYYPMPGSPFDGGEWQWEKIVENCNANLSILHADNDPFISLDEARHVAASLCYHDEHNLCEMRVVHGASHFFDPHEEILAAALKVAGRNGGGGDANGDDSGTVRHVMGGRAIRVLVLTAGLGAACCAGWEDQVRKALANGGGGAPSQGVPPPRVSILPVESTVAPDGVDSIASWGARLAQQLIDAPERHLDGRRPYILVGHDLGAWLAFEVVAELERRGREVAAPPELLVVSAMRAPHLSASQHDVARLYGSQLSQLPSAAFWGAYSAIYGSNPDLEDPDVRECFEPVLRANFRLLETYTPSRGVRGAPADGVGCAGTPPVPCAILACGQEGDSRLRPDGSDLGAWAVYAASGRFEKVVFAADARGDDDDHGRPSAAHHRYLIVAPGPFLAKLATRCAGIDDA